jgi:hypothetical protein
MARHKSHQHALDNARFHVPPSKSSECVPTYEQRLSARQVKASHGILFFAMCETLLRECFEDLATAVLQLAA